MTDELQHVDMVDHSSAQSEDFFFGGSVSRDTSIHVEMATASSECEMRPSPSLSHLLIT